MPHWIRLGICACLIITTQVWASIGKVSLLKGEAVVNRANQTIVLSNGVTLEKNDIITTHANSQLQLTFEDKTVITLGSESMLDIQDYFNDANKPRAKFKFNQGTFKSITGSIGKKAPENFTLETKTATIGIRGTTVHGKLDKNGDKIGCTHGLIAVRALGGRNFILVPAGKITFVAPGKDPTPPRDIKQGELDGDSNGKTGENNNKAETGNTGDTLNSAADTADNASSQSSNDALNSKVKETSDETTRQVYKGFAALYVDASDFQARATSIEYTHTDGLFSITAPMYSLDPISGESTFYATRITNIDTMSADAEMVNTGFYYTSNAISLDPFNITIDGSSYEISGAKKTIWHDSQGELAIAKITNNDGYSELLLAGPMSSSIPNSGLLFYQDNNELYSNPSLVTNNSDTDRTAVVVNTSNKKVLSLWIDNSAVGIGIGTLSSDASINMKNYTTEYIGNPDAPIYLSTYANMNGALYGSDNQAIGLSGIATNIAQIYDGGYDYRKGYTATSGIAFKNASTNYTLPTDLYDTHQVLSGTMVSQKLSDGTALTTNDLEITINKSSGKVSVSSTDLVIGSENSAYIHDDYFATLSTATYADTTLMKDYLMAISYDSADNDYVSWGYWGENSYQTDTDPYMSTTSTAFSTWVAGVKTPESFITALNTNPTTYSYAGHVIGSVVESGANGYIKNDASNVFNLNINFSTSTINGTMKFTTSQGNSWDMTNGITTNTFASSGFTGTVYTGPITGTIGGNFYGPHANAVAGGFDIANAATGGKAVGSFKATATTTPQITAP